MTSTASYSFTPFSLFVASLTHFSQEHTCKEAYGPTCPASRQSIRGHSLKDIFLGGRWRLAPNPPTNKYFIHNQVSTLAPTQGHHPMSESPATYTPRDAYLTPTMRRTHLRLYRTELVASTCRGHHHREMRLPGTRGAHKSLQVEAQNVGIVAFRGETVVRTP